MKYRVYALLLVCIFAFSINSVNAEDSTLRPTLEESWKTFIEAARSGQESELAKAMSSFRLGSMKNNMASAGMTLTPEIIKGMAEFSPDITAAEFKNIIENGPTAGLVYAKDLESQGQDEKPQVEFIFIKFVNEDSGWKVDGVSNTYKDKFREDGTRSEFQTSDISPNFAIDGQVKSAPEPIVVPDVVAMLDVLSYGYNTQVTINDIEQRTTTDMSSSGIVNGGLKKGSNNINIVITKTNDENVLDPEIKIRRILPGNKAEEVFLFNPKDAIEGEHNFSFTIE